MGLFGWIWKLFGWAPARDAAPTPESRQADPSSTSSSVDQKRSKGSSPPLRRKLVPTRRRMTSSNKRRRAVPYVETRGAGPYRYARYGSQTDHYLDLSSDADLNRLNQFGLPVFHTPEQLSEWIGLPLNKVAWLIHRFSAGRPATVQDAHYCFRWIQKRQGGWRLIESPKSTLKAAQTKILHDLLDRVPSHDAAHGFAQGRSILTNARPHIGQRVILRFDLQNFYTTVRFARVVAIFRGLGYSREVAIWLGLLTTSAVPANFSFQNQGPYAVIDYMRRHLPQGAPTSPALANLSAFALDARLSGFARSFGMSYTRYADDLTFSGSEITESTLCIVIPLIRQIIRDERFVPNKLKTRILRAHQRQTVTGVVVNQKPNVSRREFDLVKAILTNCVRFGPSTQNRQQVPDLHQHLMGRIAHIAMLNPDRGERLNELFSKINWSR